MTSTIIAKIKRLVAERDEYCDRRGYARELTHPAGNWAVDAARNSIHDLFTRVSSGDPEAVENLRRFAQPFSGYDLNQMEVPEGRVKIGAEKKNTANADPWVQRFYHITQTLPREYWFALPRVLGEKGTPAAFTPDGLINHDAYSYQERINLLYESGVLGWLGQASEPITILEVGGGFGGLALGLCRVLRRPIRYVIVDLPESLLYAAIYLQRTLPDRAHSFDLQPGDPGITYVANYQFDEWLEANPTPVHLAINTLSLVEMSRMQMDYYARKLQEMLRQDGIFFEQNHDGRWLGLHESKDFLMNYFPFHRQLRPVSLPCLLNGRADLWANKPLGFLDPFRPDLRETGGRLRRMRVAARDTFWLRFCLLQRIQGIMSPKMFATVKRVWNRVGGKVT